MAPTPTAVVTNPQRLAADALGTTRSRTRPDPWPRTSTATTTRALVPWARPPRRPASYPPTKHSSTSTSRVSGSRPGATIARRRLWRTIQAVLVAGDAQLTLELQG